MNLGRRRVTNDELCAAFAEHGFGEPWAFLASGNVVFETTMRSRARIEERIAAGLRATFDYDVPTFVRTAAEVAALGAATPFETSEGSAGGKLQVTLLREPASASQRRRALALATPDDRLAIEGRELFWLPAAGVSTSELDFERLEAVLGDLTVRTQRTFARLAAKLGD